MRSCAVKPRSEPSVIIALVYMQNNFRFAAYGFNRIVSLIDELCKAVPMLRASFRIDHAAGRFVADLYPIGRYAAVFQRLHYAIGIIIYVLQ